jgi:hypothetical protein
MNLTVSTLDHQRSFQLKAAGLPLHNSKRRALAMEPLYEANDGRRLRAEKWSASVRWSGNHTAMTVVAASWSKGHDGSKLDRPPLYAAPL